MAERYSTTVMDHFLNPRNVGDLPDAHGVGMANNPHDGDTVRFAIRVEEGVIEAARFKAQGCVAAIAGSSALTELVQGKDLGEALTLTKEDLAAALDGLSERKQACSLTCLEALRFAVEQCEPSLVK
ncbi:MAG: iron-sulfur cluster assembly scaffold protein [Anaerolineales bacterium]|nr:MAG: iron-sulfur cluster assembly scaffold protein [Anaerolineales bacterium]